MKGEKMTETTTNRAPDRSRAEGRTSCELENARHADRAPQGERPDLRREP